MIRSCPSTGRGAPAVRAVLGFAALLMLLAGCATSDSFPGMSKFGGGDTTAFFVVLRSQAPLESAPSISDFGARGVYVVSQLKREAAASQGPVIAFLEQRGVKYHAFWIANMVWVEADDHTRKDLAALPEVESIEPDATITLDDPTAPTAAASGTITDPNWVEPNVSRVHAPDVWNLGYTGKGVVVGIIDTGVYRDHAALTGKFIDGTNTVDRTGIIDQNGHGTHVTGTILGLAVNNAIGVAPGAKYLSCKALNAGGSGRWSTVVACIEWMAEHAPNHPQVVNMSLGGGFADGMAKPLENLVKAGTLPVAAAGNMGGCNTVGSPAGFGEVVAVGALTEKTEVNTMATYSSGGQGQGVNTNKPDVVAQGSAVRSAWIGSTTAYKTISGTSMASPSVAGVAALILSANPSLKPADVAQILKRTADGNVTGAKCPVPNSFGTGLVNASRAVEEALKLPARTQ